MTPRFSLSNWFNASIYIYSAERANSVSSDIVVLTDKKIKKFACKPRSNNFTHPVWYKVTKGQKQKIGRNKEAISPYSRDCGWKGRCLTFAKVEMSGAGTYICEATNVVYGWTETVKILKVIVTGVT